MKFRLINFILAISLLLSLSSCTDLVILMTGNSPSKIRSGCETPEPGTYLDPLSNLMLVMAHRFNDRPDSVVESNLKIVRIMTPRVRTRIDTTIQSFDGYDVPVRIYNNRPVMKRENQRVILFFHGGGFVWGDIEIYDNLCSKIARKTGAVLVSVGYRLAPEYPYPYAIKDAWDILLWASGNIQKYGGNTRKITVMGDSAGGNISAVLSVISREKGSPEIESQVLIYPLTMFIDTLTPSRKYFIYDNDRDFVLSDNFLEKADNSYLQNNEDRRDPTISPHFAEIDSLYPRSLIITAQCDPLRDEGKYYAEKLKDAGVKTEYFEGKGMMHGFVSFYQALREGRRAVRLLAEFCRNNEPLPGEK